MDLRFLNRLVNHWFLGKLIRGQKILLIGSGPSAAELPAIPEGYLLFTCNAALRFFDHRPETRKLDLYFCNKAKMEREKDVQDRIRRIGTRYFVSRNVDYVRQNKRLEHSYDHLLYDDSTDPLYLKRLIRPHKISEIMGRCPAHWTSTGMRLLQYALYYGAKEIYIAGMDFGENGYFWGPKPNPWGHPDIDENFFRIVSKKHRSIYSLSKQSAVTRYVPYADLRHLSR